MKWSEVEIGSLCTVARGGSPRPINQFMTEDDDGVNWIKISDATASGKVIRSTKERIKPEGLAKSRAVFAGDFLLSNSMSFGRPYLLEIDGAIHDGWLVLQDMSPRLDKAYLYEALQAPSVQSQFQKRASGTTVKNLNAEIVRTVKIPLPPLEEQRRIAEILDEADRVRKKTQALIDKYDELAQSLFLDMFGDPVANSKGWEVKPLGSVIELVNGRAYKKDELLNEGTPVLRIQNLNGGQRWYFSDLDLPQSKYCHKGDLLFAWSASFGPYIFDGPKSIFHYHIWNCRIEKKAQIPFYFGLLKQLTDQIKSNSHGASMLHMTKGGMEQMEIIVPPDSVIAEFTELREKNATQRQGLIIELSRAESLFNALLQKAFKGELT